MSNFFLLLRVRLDQMFEISATFKQTKWTKKVGMIVHDIIMVALYAVMFGIVYMMADYLKNQGLAEALPVTGYFGAVALTFIFTIIKISETFTGNEDSEYLLSMPFSSAVQVFVMFVIMYIRNLLCCLLIQLPTYIVYKSAVTDGTLAFGKWLWGLLLTSLPICGIAVMIGMVIILSLVHTPKKNQIIAAIEFFFLAIAILLTIVLADRIYLVAIGKVTYEGQTLAAGLVKEICRNFKFGRFYQMGIVQGDFGYTILFSFMSLIWYGVLLFMHTMAYQSVITQLRCPVSYGELTREEVAKKLKASSTFKVLLRKEIEQFTRSENYLLQCAIGVLLAIEVPLNFLIIGTEGLDMLKGIIPFVLCIFVGISNTTYCSMSMEGRRYWIMESAPVNNLLLSNAKLVLNLIITVPVTIFSAIVFAVAFDIGVVYTVLYILLAIVYAVVLAFWGNFIGIRFADFSFEKESMILHRGVPFLLGYLPGIIIPLFSIVIFL